MDKLSMSSPTIIVVIGLPGSGKSFFATQFAETFDAALVSEDKIRWMLFAHHTYDDNEKTIVKQVSDMMMAELLKTKKTIILDGGYNDRPARTTLATSAKKAGYKILTVVVQTDAPTAERRSTKRDARKAGDRYKQSLDATEFARQAKEYQAPTRFDKATVVISGKHTYSTQARTVLKKILETQEPAPAAPQPQPAPIVRPRGPFVQ
ncbi:ATP-binding protein [Candidatus Saccharibacteria bacterium]|nr:ATP-binding protein [Candidatus Saccharibacteria bacterium]